MKSNRMHQNMLVLEQMAQTELVVFFDEVTDVYDMRTEVNRHFGKALNMVPWEKLLVKVEKVEITEGCKRYRASQKGKDNWDPISGPRSITMGDTRSMSGRTGWYLSPEYILLYVQPVHTKFGTAGFKNKCSILITVTAGKFCGSPTPGPLLQTEISQLLLERGKSRKSSTG